MAQQDSKLITYEHPLNERVRLLLRLQHLFDLFAQYLPGNSAGDTRNAVDLLLEINSVLLRSDLKSEVIKELERQLAKLIKLTHLNSVNREKLSVILDGLERKIAALNSLRGQLGAHLRDDEFFKTISQRSAIPGGTCDFDLPIYHLWLEGKPESRRELLQNWIAPLLPLRDATDLLIELIRTSSTPHVITAEEGFYQQSLDKNVPVQMLRITLPIARCYFPEVSGGKHRFSIRFMHFAEAAQRPVQVTEDLSFQLTTCVL